ncbi:E4 SUMO-protein ligase PIAL2-like [Mercurialis annua]|uniref:E4 SUMO-protein ligase PIAL2-like n=1 Tax=Mercurialis annua TaxID=3986 RepID=UPI00215EA43B|nr:E4 SUMO-protein ligase PIAL2-like [Mercurialis annua]
MEGRTTSGIEASVLLAEVIDLLATEIRSSDQQPANPTFLTSLCRCLARVIDYAVACDEVPSRVQQLPLLLKQVCQYSNDDIDASVQAAVMVLMISVKNACKNGWFPVEDTVNLLILAEQAANLFSNVDDVNAVPTDEFPVITKIVNRFYPKIKLGNMLAFLKVKPGFRAFTADFNISNKTTPVQEEIGLFVAKLNDVNTSSCIVTPPQANFLLNGKGVEGRTNCSMDCEPQLPTNVTAMLEQGMNLLQAVGQFDDDYIVAIAYMHELSAFDSIMIPDYIKPVTSSDSCSDVILEPTQVSLNCPISKTRIRTPVKGHCCNHYQCFDFESFMMSNSKRPSWRCPVCNQSVCYPDIRIDQDTAKILKEVGDNALYVVISANGSWKVILESNDDADPPYKRMKGCQRERPEQHDSGGKMSRPANVIDLTAEEADSAQGISISDSEARRHQDNPRNSLLAENLAPSDADIIGDDNNKKFLRNVAVQTEEDMHFTAGCTLATPDTSMADCTSAANTEHEENTSRVSSTTGSQYPILEISSGVNFLVSNGDFSHSLPFAALDGRIAGNASTENSQQLGRVSMNVLPVADIASPSAQNHLSTQVSNNKNVLQNVAVQTGKNTSSTASGCTSAVPATSMADCTATANTEHGGNEGRVSSTTQSQNPMLSEISSGLNLRVPNRDSSHSMPFASPDGRIAGNASTESSQQLGRVSMNVMPVADTASPSTQNRLLTQDQGGQQIHTPVVPLRRPRSKNMFNTPWSATFSGMLAAQAAIQSQNTFQAPQNSNRSGMRTNQAAITPQDLVQPQQYSSLFRMRTAQAAFPSQNLIEEPNLSGMKVTQAPAPSQDLIQAQQHQFASMRTSQAAPQPQNMTEAPVYPSNTRAAPHIQHTVNPSTDAQVIHQLQLSGSANQVSGAATDDQLPQKTTPQSTPHVPKTALFAPVYLGPSGTSSPLTQGIVTQPHMTTGKRRDAVGIPQPTDSVVETSGKSASTDKWRPTGKMRGSLTGQAYAAYKQFVTRPIQPSQAATNPSKHPTIPQ